MQLLHLKEPKLLEATLEAEERHLQAFRHLLETMHHIDLSSARTEEIGETTNATSNKEEDNGSNNPDTTPPTPCDG